MKRIILLSVGILGIMTFAASAAWLEEGTRAIRADAFFDEDSIDESSIGFEGGFGVSLYDLDDVGLFGMYKETDRDDEFYAGGLYIEEHYPIGVPLVPFAGVAVGYGRLDATQLEAEESVFGRVMGGVKWMIGESAALSATLRWSLADKDIFIDDQEFDNRELDIAFGVRFYY